MMHKKMMHKKSKEGLIDNRMVHDNHQEGISRVLQRRHERMDVEGHNGKMGKGDKAHFKRSDCAMTPRKA